MVHHHAPLHRRQWSDLGSRLMERANNLRNERLFSVSLSRDEDSVATVFSVIYITAPATFTGPTAGFITQTGNNAAVNTGLPDSRQNTNAAAQTPAQNTQRITAVTSDAGFPEQTAMVGTPIMSDPQGTSVASTSNQGSSQNAGMSGGAKAGVAFGVIAIIALIAGIIFFVIRRKKQQKKDEQESHDLDNEKSGFEFAAVNNTPRNENDGNINSRAPRLSLRPVTQFLPSIGDHKVQEMTSATGGLNSFLPPPPPPQHTRQNSWDRPATHNSNEAANPFGTSAERIDNHAADMAADRAAENAPIPVPQAATIRPEVADPFLDRPSTARSISPVEDGLLVTAPSSPQKPETAGVAAAAALGAAGVAAGRTSPQGSPTKGEGNVHRVQLDFKPSMQDEIDLRAGDVVRILHEYDDGWALCSRMDRSKQGVAPRTCLSKHPLKPRPTGPPPGMRPFRPDSPSGAGARNFSGPPALGGNSMYPAPLSPSLPNMHAAPPRNDASSPPRAAAGRMSSHSHSRSMDNGNRGSPQMLQSVGFGMSPVRDHRRSASMGQLGLGPASTRTQVPIRKPVPGQAL